MPNVLKDIYNRIKGLNHYNRSVLFSLPLGIGLLLAVIFLEPGNVMFSEWFLAMLAGPTMVSGFVSSATYIGRLCDAHSRHNINTSENDLTPAKPLVGARERAMTWLGFIIVIAATSWIIAKEYVVPFMEAFGEFAYVLFAFNLIGSVVGVCNRIGMIIEPNNARSLQEKTTILLGLLTGLGLGIAMIATFATASNFAMLGVVGVTTFFTGGAALPFWITAFVFGLTFSSTWASAGDYIGKGIYYLRAGFNNDIRRKILDEANGNKNSKWHEYEGAFLGMSIGITLGLVAVALILVLQPHILLSAIAAVMIVVTAASVLGGLFSRVGKKIDGFKAEAAQKKAKSREESKVEQEPQPQLQSQPQPQPHLDPQAALPKSNSALSLNKIGATLQSAPKPVPSLRASRSANDLTQITTPAKEVKSDLMAWHSTNKAKVSNLGTFSPPEVRPIVNKPTSKPAATKSLNVR